MRQLSGVLDAQGEERQLQGPLNASISRNSCRLGRVYMRHEARAAVRVLSFRMSFILNVSLTFHFHWDIMGVLQWVVLQLCDPGTAAARRLISIFHFHYNITIV